MKKYSQIIPDKTPSIFSVKKASRVSDTLEPVHTSELDKIKKLDKDNQDLVNYFIKNSCTNVKDNGITTNINK